MAEIRIKNHEGQAEQLDKLLARVFDVRRAARVDDGQTLVYDVALAARKADRTLPAPNIEFVAAGDAPRALEVNGLRTMFMNPIYAGVGPYPAMLTDDVFVPVHASMIRRDGPDQYLVNLLYLLRRSLGFSAHSPLPTIEATDNGVEFEPGAMLHVRLSPADQEALRPFENALGVILLLRPISKQSAGRQRRYVSQSLVSRKLPGLRAWSEERPLTIEIGRFGRTNPLVAGVGPFDRAMTDDEWIAGAVESLFEGGPEQFVVNMLFSLRISLANFQLEGMTK